MKLYEFCNAYNIKLELEPTNWGYSVKLEGFNGVKWQEIEHLDVEGGTTWSTFMDTTPNLAMIKLCEFISGRMLCIEGRDKFRCPQLEI